MRSVFTAISLCASLLAVPALAAAQDNDAGAAIRGTYTLPTIVVEGRRQEPGAEYVLTRGRGGRYEVRDLRTSFVREVVRTVDRGPF